MELEQIACEGLENIYALSIVKKEFKKTVDEPWKENPPWQRYQKKLMADLAVLDQEKEKAITLAGFEKITGSERIYSIRYPNSRKNIRVLYAISDGAVILLMAFLEKTDNDYHNAIRLAENRLKCLESD